MLCHTFAQRCLVVVLWILTVLTPMSLSAQKVPKGPLQAPHAGYAYPAGVKVGSTARIIIGGQYLSPDARILLDGGGITVTVAGHHRPLTQSEFNKARDRIEQILQGAGASKDAKQLSDLKPELLAKLSEEERAELRSLRQRMQEGNPRRVTNPAIAELLLLDVAVAADAAPGTRELRILTEQGLSNPLVFKVGTLPEVVADAITLEPPSESKAPRKRQTDQQGAVARTETMVSLPVVANGRILQGGVDRFRFGARKGQRLVFATEARALIPYLADAVPGWFQATLTVFDAKGRELAYNDDYRFSPDPVVLFEVPEDGDYMIDIKDAIFRGREDFVYRLTLGELPFVTGLFPLGGRVGTTTAVEASGWNLKSTKSMIDNSRREPGVVGVSVPGISHLARPVAFELTESPELLESEGNDGPEKAQLLTVPCVVNGRIQQEGDRDWFRFEGKAGQTVVAEVRARRLGSPLDSQLRLLDAQGNQLAFNDDHEDKAAGLLTHHADSLVQAKLPADGVYRIELLDVQHQGGALCTYRLHLRAPSEDFELRLDTSALNTKENGIVAFTVHVLRRDGFTGPIHLALAESNLPARLDGAEIPAGVDRIRLTLSVRAEARTFPYQFGIVGTGKTSSGRSLTRLAIPCDDMMQAFAYRQLVEAKGAYLFVAPSDARRQPLRIECSKPLAFRDGRSVRLFVPLPQRRMLDAFRVELSEPPAGISIVSQQPVATGLEIELGYDASKQKGGQSGNLLFTGHMEQAAGKKDNGKPKSIRKVPVGFLPAVPYSVK